MLCRRCEQKAVYPSSLGFCDACDLDFMGWVYENRMNDLKELTRNDDFCKQLMDLFMQSTVVTQKFGLWDVKLR